MKISMTPLMLSLIVGLVTWVPLASGAKNVSKILLPPPAVKGTVTIEEALKTRRTHRSFASRPLTLEQLSQILWAAYGVTAKVPGYQLKTSPSAGALYPLDIYAVVGDGCVKSVAPGVYHYVPKNHSMGCIKQDDRRTEVARHALGQMWVAEAPILIVITGEYGRCSVKYGRRGVVYTHIEAGHVGQNIFLQAEAMGLKAGIVGAFNNEQIIRSLGLPAEHDPLLIMPVGFSD